MSEKKNIERFFQEKFKDFETTPPEHVWNSVEASLNKKQKSKKAIPLWWQMGGAAAILAGIALLGSLFFTSPEKHNNPVTNTETQENIQSPDKKIPFGTKDALVDTPNENGATEKEETLPPGENTKATVTEAERNGSETTTKTSKEASKNAIATHQSNQNGKEKTINHNQNETVTSGAENAAIAQNEVVEDSVNNEAEKSGNLTPTSQSAVAKNETEVSDSSNAPQKKSLLDVIAEMEKQKEEEAIASNESKKQAKWTVNPNVAPVYYNTLSKGSPISRQFSENPKEGDISMSYGINIAYNISKRLSIRSGINSVNMGYSTDDIEFGPSIASNYNQTLMNVTFKTSQGNLAVSDAKTPVYSADSELLSRTENVYQGKMTQKFGYLEVPMELKYRLIDKKFGVNIIGGVSSLFLTDNKVSLNSNNNLSTEVGEANNLNDLNFSTNIGLGLDYQVSNKLLFNLEPMFKYQLNTFSAEDGGFSPYMLGVYTGLSFKF